MIVDRVLRDLDTPDTDERGGNPLRGSRLGRCARQSAYMLFPEAYPPEPLAARAKLVFAFGNLIHDMLRAQFRRVVPGSWGMEEERFHLKVPLTTKDAKAALKLFKAGALRGYVQARGVLTYYFMRPGNYHGSTRVERAARPVGRRGLWLDVAEPALYVPLHVDGIADTGDGLASAEIKSMATYSFLRAVKGHVDYAYRVQMAAAVEATGLDAALYVAVRKDTSHTLEVLYSRKESAVSIEFTKTAYRTDAVAVTIEDDSTEWEAAEVRHPFEPHLLEQARERVRRILRATLTTLPEREYGPSFVCETCDGTGTQTKRKNTGEPLKNGAKPCQDCEPADVPVNGDSIEKVGPPSGWVAMSELPWQCRYCAFVVHCWPMAKLVIEAERPHYRISREDFQASGITFTSPETEK